MALSASFVATVPIPISSGVGREETGLKYNRINIGSLLQLQQLDTYTCARGLARDALWVSRYYTMADNECEWFYYVLQTIRNIRLLQK